MHLMPEQIARIASAWVYESYASRSVPRFGTRFLAYRPAFLAAVLLVLVSVVSILAPLVAPYAPDEIDLDSQLEGPSPAHVLGTDELGRDVLTRLVYGGRFTLLVACACILIATSLGVLAGAFAGYCGGPVDFLVSSAVDLFLSVPVFLVILIAASLGGGRLWLIPLVIGGTSWMETARVVRASFISLRGEGFVEAARSVGVRNASIILRHILPLALPPVVIAATVGFAQAMLIESALSFLGFGVQPPTPTWGNMLYNAQLLIRRAPVAAFAPGCAIFVTCLCINTVGRGLRRALARERVSS
jgi:peptide/nickel transport system permease protein